MTPTARDNSRLPGLLLKIILSKVLNFAIVR
jgi:hypothetical protein